MLRTRRIFAAWLLSVILPVVFLAPFHHHHRDALEDIHCEACSQHIPHQGHLTPGTGTNDCLVCQLLSQQYVPAPGLAVNLHSSDYAAVIGDFSDDVILCFTHLSSPRAPPVSFPF